MLTEQTASEFALMLMAGLPAKEAIGYFVDSDDPAVVASTLKTWMRSRLLRAAMLALEGKPWHRLSDDERWRNALSQHYNQLATLLRGNHYADADGGLKAKMDAARVALEAKLAGQAGRGDALSQFLSDISSGKVKLQGAPQQLPRLQ